MNKLGNTILGLTFVTVLPVIGAFILGRSKSKEAYYQGRIDALKDLKAKIILEDIIPNLQDRERA